MLPFIIHESISTIDEQQGSSVFVPLFAFSLLGDFLGSNELLKDATFWAVDRFNAPTCNGDVIESTDTV